jgi:septal ring factor EnvC (AmiA/AmiB activator)
MDTGWSLKESLSDSLAAYKKASKIIRTEITNITMMNTKLASFLISETRPIPINPNATSAIDKRTDYIKNELKDYYREIKKAKAPFPKFDTEIKQHKDLIKKINKNISRINEINSCYSGLPIIAHVKEL